MLIGYARVSTDDQTTALQLDALKKAGCKKIYEETASGAETERPQLARLLENVRDNDVLVVWRLDRLGRNLKHLIETINRLMESKVGFRSLTDPVDTTTSSGRLVFNIFGALAQFERDTISERTRAGLAAARARGRLGGRKRKITDDKLRAARALLKDPEHTLKAAAAAIGVSYPTLWRALRRVSAEQAVPEKVAPVRAKRQTPTRFAGASARRERSRPVLQARKKRR